ncbi:hypothetical protein EfmJHP38_12040 [Enterococcus faecium]|nr:hypothetical protein EfmJHP38_12040 [Enterococcus faecium]
MATGSKILLSIFGSSIIYSLYKPLAQKDESKVKALMNLYKKTYEFIGIFIGNVYPAKDFESAVWVPFEDTEMPVPVGYDNYLSQVFGDYMQLPPEKDQVSIKKVIWLRLMILPFYSL